MSSENQNHRRDLFESRGPSRRQFVGSTFAAVAVTAAGSHWAIGDAPASKPAVAATLGFNTYGFRTMKTEDVIRELAKIGYDSVQFDSGEGRDADPVTVNAGRRGDFRRVLSDCGMKLTAMQGVGRPSSSDKQHKADMERLRTMIEFAHELCPDHPPLIEAGLGGKDPWAKMKPLFERRVADWIKLAEASDITIVVKPHRDTSMDRPEEAVELFKDLGSSPRLRMSFDYSHFALRDMPLEETIRIALPWTGFVAIKDVAVENGKSAFRLPGETGKIDYVALLRQFFQGGYAGDFNCEVSVQLFKKPGYDMIAAAKTSYANIAPAFIAAGVPRQQRKQAADVR